MVNIVVIQGRLVYDPELRYTSTGKAVATVRLAWSEKINESENKLFLDCTFWGKTAEFARKFFRRGQEAIVTGKLLTRAWSGSDGKQHQKQELVGQIGFCGSRKQDGEGPLQRSSGHTETFGEYNQIEPDQFNDLLDNDDGDLPF